jgi:GH35 family endo-1,4-beta-xylanase
MWQSGTPFDAVGVQAHLSCAGGPPFSASRLRRFLAESAALGLTIQISEVGGDLGIIGSAQLDCSERDSSI